MRITRVVVVDALVIALAHGMALLFRFWGPIPSHLREGLLMALPYLVVAYLVANALLGVYRSPSMRRMSGAVGVAVLTIVVVTVGFRSVSGLGGPVPLTVILLGGLLTLAGMLALRIGAEKARA